MKKKISVHIAIILILVGGFLNVYIKATCLPCGGNQLSAYADDDTYSWESVSKDDLVTAFKYYCKSRNLVIEGSVADAVTKFTTSTFNNICNNLGIDSTALQAELKKTTGGNLGLRFLFTQTGVNAYNRIFAEFLQNNDLDVGDDVSDIGVYSGKYYTDYDGNSCLVYILPTTKNGNSDDNVPIAVGSPYMYTTDELVSLINNGISNFTAKINSNNGYTCRLYKYENETLSYYDNRVTAYTGYSNYTNLYNWLYGVDVANNNILYKGNFAIYYCTSNDSLYLGLYGRSYGNFDITGNNYFWDYLTGISQSNNNLTDTNIYVTTNNNTINNNTYNNNYTIIYNDGDYYDYDDDDEPDPSTPPGSGGDDPDPDEPPIVDPTPTPDPSVPDWDIELPDMPVGNEWLLYGLEKKFPWDIPFNLMYMLSLFAADPETPHFQGTIDLKIVQWNYDIDLAPFDDIAKNFRNFEFVGFIIGLMLLTRKLIWG